MAITNGYTTLVALKAALKIGDVTDDTRLELSIEAASRQIDDHVGRGRKFWVDGSVVARKYFPCSARTLYVDDVSTVTGLIVKVDTSDDGTFDTTLTINTDFTVHPANAAAEVPVRPFENIRLIDGALAGFVSSSSGRPSVEVTAKYGWPAVPEAVERACVFQAKNIFKAPDTMYGSFQLAQEGSALKVPSMDPLARALLEGFIRHVEVNDE
ncbi:MAG: hypothetical protein DRR03_10910 [Gammaproteobacteria bacterium]|nr:MAG: hypothetical protein DRR03_10910 [Gammaproteobacteria bacterium]